jgi:hypothetical protein
VSPKNGIGSCHTMHRRRILVNIKSAQGDLRLWESSMLKIRILSTGSCPQEQLRGVGPSFNARSTR